MRYQRVALHFSHADTAANLQNVTHFEQDSAKWRTFRPFTGCLVSLLIGPVERTWYLREHKRAVHKKVTNLEGEGRTCR